MGLFKSIKSAFVESGPSKADVSESEEIELNELVKFLNIEGTDDSSLSEATYFACIKVLGEAVGKLPLKLLRYTDKNGVENAREHPLYSILGTRPNQFMSATTFWSTVEYNRNHYGNAYVLISGAGRNTKLWILPSDKVSIWYDDRKLISNVADIYYIYTANGRKHVFGSEQILHFKSSNTFDGITGVSVRDQLKMTIRGNNKAQKMLNSMYDSGFSTKTVLQYTGSLSDENVKKFVSNITAYVNGEVKNDGINRVIPIPLGSTLTPLDVSLGENQFIEIKQYSALQIASAFGIKPYQIGDYTKASYASAEAQQLSFYIDTLLYIVKQYEEELTYKLLTDEEVRKGYHFKFNVAVILRADHKTQIETLAKAVNSFIYTPNEARSFLDLEVKEGGDQLLGNGASIPLQFAGSQYIKDFVEQPGDEENEGEEVGNE